MDFPDMHVSLQEKGLEVQQFNLTQQWLQCFDGGNNIYDDPMFDYQEQCAAVGLSLNGSHEIFGNIRSRTEI